MDKLRQGGFLISKIHQLSGRIFAKKLKEYNAGDINPAQGRILFFLWQNDGISIQEVSKLTSLEKSTLTSMLDRLEAAGYIKRVPCKDDRRKILIEVVNKDEGMKKAYEQVVQDVSEVFYKGFQKKEVDELEEYLRRIFTNLEEYEKES